MQKCNNSSNECKFIEELEIIIGIFKLNNTHLTHDSNNSIGCQHQKYE